ncbi:MAG TPA: enoyl-CoA hydratase-related protein [Burkholderiales bacterium]|nr:enoyl-CoA hydratase-related protein [Burkholderiales bacterium]
MAAQSEVLYEIRGECALITLNRPDQRNAIDRPTCAQLWKAFEDFDKDPALRVAILTGAGDRAFSAGRDLKEATREEDIPLPPLPILGDTLHVTKPVIAAVNGAAIAGGWVMAQMCDLCVAADHATFGITEPKVGRGVAWSPPMIHMLGSRIALELMLTGRTIAAQRAYEIGFVNKVVPRAELIDASLAMAADIIECAPLSVVAVRQVVRHTLNMGMEAAMEVGKQVCAPLYVSEDAKEGARAFKEKRKPRWQGR